MSAVWDVGLLAVFIMLLVGCDAFDGSEPDRSTAAGANPPAPEGSAPAADDGAIGDTAGEGPASGGAAESDGPPTELVYAESDGVSRFVLAGRPVVLSITISLPSPAWSWDRFEVRQEKAVPPRVVISPRAQVPPPGTMAAQVMVTRRESAVLGVLPAGDYQVVVESRGRDQPEPRPMTVVPADSLACVVLQGGIAALHRTILVLDDGRLILWSRRHPQQRTLRLDTENLAAVRALLGTLPERPVSESSERGADLMAYDLAWRVKRSLREVAVDDGTARGPIGELIRLLGSFWQEPRG